MFPIQTVPLHEHILAGAPLIQIVVYQMQPIQFHHNNTPPFLIRHIHNKVSNLIQL